MVYATHASVKGVNCTVCGSEIMCAHVSKITTSVASASKIARMCKPVSVSKIQGLSGKRGQITNQYF